VAYISTNLVVFIYASTPRPRYVCVITLLHYATLWVRLEVAFIYEIVIYVDRFTFMQRHTYTQVSVSLESMTEHSLVEGSDIYFVVTGITYML
jgi:hypothetical protein